MQNATEYLPFLLILYAYFLSMAHDTYVFLIHVGAIHVILTSFCAKSENLMRAVINAAHTFNLTCSIK